MGLALGIIKDPLYGNVRLRIVYIPGFGYADLENRVIMNPATSMRIASISKALTMAAVAKLMENGRLDLDRPVSEYVAEWPKDKPIMTSRQLVSHLAGVRHYLTKEEMEKKEALEKEEELEKSTG